MSNATERYATPDHPILEPIAQRWSPYVFEPREVEREKLLACLEAARWAASSFNEQPWTFFVSQRSDETEFPRMLACLMEANQGWAQHAGALLLTVAAKTFSRNDKPNRVAVHDIGLAVGNLSVQATSLGLVVHQMAGIELDKARETYAIPESHDPVTAIAIGYAGDPSQADEQLAQRDQGPRARKPLSDFVFSGTWAKSAEV